MRTESDPIPALRTFAPLRECSRSLLAAAPLRETLVELPCGTQRDGGTSVLPLVLPAPRFCMNTLVCYHLLAALPPVALPTLRGAAADHFRHAQP